MSLTFKTSSDLTKKYHLARCSVSKWAKEGLVRREPMPLTPLRRLPWFSYCEEDVVSVMGTKRRIPFKF